MKKSKIVILGIISTAMLLSISCEKKVGKTKSEDTTTTGTPPPVVNCDTITYTKHIKAIIDAECLRCHSTATLVEGNTKLENYDLVKEKAQTGRIKARVIDGPNFMPADKGKLPQAQLELIQCWLNNGMKQ